MIFFASWRQTSAWINHPRTVAVVLITVLTLSVSLLLSAGDSAAQTSTSWSYCASEGNQCNFSGTREVRYGAHGTYAYGIFTNGVDCHNGVFGDPLYGYGKACELGNATTQSTSSTPTTPTATSNTSWSYCASEGGQCNFSGTREVRYGAHGTYAYGIFTNSVGCNNGVFGDPLYGYGKACELGNATTQSTSSTPTIPTATSNTSWSYCASEGGQCNFSGTREVRYGAHGTYAYGIFTNGVDCHNGVFGDPLYGYGKACELGNATTQSTSSTPTTPTATSNTSWSYCASEGGQCNFSGTREVRYGAHGTYAYGIFTNSVSCNNGVFGDPLYGYGKACEIENGATQSTSTTPNPISTTSTDTGASYYVGKKGSDSYSCSQARSSSTPKLTINAALVCVGTSLGAGANQVVEVAAGTYGETIGPAIPSGTSWGNPFTLRAKIGDTATIKTNSGNNILLISANLFSIIQGFVLDGTNTTNNPQIYIGDCCDGPGYIRFINNELINTLASHAIVVGEFSHHVEFISNKIHGGSFSMPGTSGGNYGYPIYLQGSDNTISGNEIYDFPSWGVHGYNGSAPFPSNNVIRNNTIHDFGWGDSRSSGVLIYVGNENQVYDNVIYNGSRGISIGPAATNTQIHNNNVYNMLK